MSVDPNSSLESQCDAGGTGFNEPVHSTNKNNYEGNKASGRELQYQLRVAYPLSGSKCDRRDRYRNCRSNERGDPKSFGRAGSAG
jgi:hypothetical protein